MHSSLADDTALNNVLISSSSGGLYMGSLSQGQVRDKKEKSMHVYLPQHVALKENHILLTRFSWWWK